MGTSVRTLIASQFEFLAPRVRLDHLIALAEHFAEEGGWPEGWAGVCKALRNAQKAENGGESAAKLSLLEKKLAPSSLSDRIASYVLPSRWGAFDLADVDFDDPQRHEKAHLAIEAVCIGIGAELAEDVDGLRDHLRELLWSTSEKTYTVARTIGQMARNPDLLWKTIEEFVFMSDGDGKISSFPAGFLAGLSEKDERKANHLLDVMVSTPQWHPFLPYAQSRVGIDETGCDRLVTIMFSESLPVWTLRTLTSGRSTDGVTGVHFKALLAAIAQKDGGLDIATEILYMRLFSLQSEKKPVTEVEREVARMLLKQITFEGGNYQESYKLGEIVRDCLNHPADDLLARTLCQRVLIAIATYKASPFDYREFLAEIAGVFPRIFLEEVLESHDEEIRTGRGFRNSIRDDGPCLFRKIDDEVLLQWAHEKPSTRFTAISECLLGWRSPQGEQNPEMSTGDEIVGLKWTPAALRLIHESPDPIPVLDAFAKQFKPMGWSGSLADILLGRQFLLVQLSSDPNARIAEWASAATLELAEEVERERDREAKEHCEQNERFDW